MITNDTFPVSHAHFNVSMGFRGAAGDYPMVTPAPDHVATNEKTTPLALTGKQKVARMLEKGGMSHAEIADRMGLKHRETATRLCIRARRAETAANRAIAEFIGNP
jgi:hypothetical protein